MSFQIEPVIFKGKLVTLRPLALSDRDDLLAAAKDGNLSKLWYTGVPDESSIDNTINIALQSMDKREQIPYVVVLNSSGKIVGSTRYCNIDAANRRLEIGYTWYSKSVQRTGVNTECKLLLLQHAFESLKAIAVVFCTHWFNQASRNAILRLGAKQDGVLRNHRILPDGSYRDTVVFSIIESEWLATKRHLTHKLDFYS
ncbi:GNAT family N-acetyltransferase [Aliikangiella sp. IMCC44359]|uniref:GNAT family N-acetyltransferase n=1 Tax=Aliikangiella sp. IMCC44359 TaxID=3459125 RepID=UPI00403AD64E